MNTPAHLLIGAALFGHRNNGVVLGGALLGGLIPDFSLYLMAGISLFVLSIPANLVFNELYFSDSWQLVFGIDNSLLLWGAACAFSLKSGKPFFIALTGAALVHLICDFALHNDDARAHFWPLSQWRFFSPLSYWDSQHHAAIVAPVEGAIAAVATLFLIRNRWHLSIKIGMVLLLVAELVVLTNWLMYF